MKHTDLQLQIAATLLPNFGNKRMRTILSHLDSLEEFFTAKKQHLKAIPGIGENLIRQLNRKEALVLAENHVDFFIKHPVIEPIFYTDISYPKRLNECVDAPLLLFKRGNLDPNVGKTVAIVGTRNATSYGKQICEELIESFDGKNILVVSGLAYGVDVIAHQLCIKHQIQTIGVLGHGLDIIYPSVHKKTAIEMMENGGLLTEFLPGTKPDRENFPMRNRIVAGMADVTIVVESGIKGGSLITADFANDYAREVAAFPGDISRTYSKGCNALIKNDKAHLITDSSDLFRLMNWETDTQKSKVTLLDLFSNLSDLEKKIVSCFKEKAELSYDYLIQKTSLTFSELSANLLNLEFSGILKAMPGKNYKINV